MIEAFAASDRQAAAVAAVAAVGAGQVVSRPAL